MVHSFHPRLKAVVAGGASLLLLALAGIAEGQTLRGPDLGLWFRQERDASGRSALIVDYLVDDGPFASAGLREGDRIVSVDGRPIDSEPQFIRRMTSPSNGDHVFSLVVTRTELGGTALSNTLQEQTISLKTRDVWKGAVAADPFYQAGFLVDEGHRDSVVVLRVFPLTPAFYAGLRQADTITSVSGQPVTSPPDVPQYLRVGGRLALGVKRSGESRQLHILLPSRRAMASATYPPSGGVQPPSPLVPNLQTPAPLLIPPQIPSALSPIPSLPMAIPQLPPPGTVLNGPPH
jgi:S1-C subfamily serine protease